jgi:acyl dehydratase
MGTYHELTVGDSFTTPGRMLEQSDVHALVAAGGYTHPLFTDPVYAAASPFGRPPVPGEAVLLVMGGLVEQSGRFDETVIALLGFDAVRFASPAFAGDEVRVEVRVSSKEPTRDGTRGILAMSWRCLNARNETLVEATARMLFRLARPVGQ